MSDKGFDEADCGRTSTGGRSCRWSDLSVLILSLLLSAMVATVIFMAVKAPAATCQTPSQSPSVPRNAPTPVNVQVSVDGETIKERVSYDEDSNVVFTYEEDGSFTAEDFDKGFVISGIPGSDECVVAPVGAMMNRTQVGSIISSYASDVVEGQRGKTVHAQVLPGYISDTSMFPDEANRLCTGGYRWLTTVDESDEGAFEAGVREKRQISGCGCSVPVYVTYTNSWFLRYYSRRFWICIPSCFDSDCTLRYRCR